MLYNENNATEMPTVYVNKFGVEVKWPCKGMTPWLKLKFLNGYRATDQQITRDWFVGQKGYSEDLVEKNMKHVSAISRSMITTIRKSKWAKKHKLDLIDIGDSKGVYGLKKFNKSTKIKPTQSSLFVNKKMSQEVYWKDKRNNVTPISKMDITHAKNLYKIIRKLPSKKMCYSGYTYGVVAEALEKRILKSI